MTVCFRISYCFYTDETPVTGKRCSEIAGIIPASVTFRPTPVISRRTGIVKMKDYKRWDAEW
ncbi:hypothetical protein [Pedobacter sp. CFBP9032]|uniref:hypothetical protein n=1 Tax=Pedobacter sp. CFBP9032 TaxID=3096539 RepID=UPI002A6AAAC4|nr:hypothetical protein [Pedobacter sp. CFBP9032]MDY0905049.1 hypothetical protein [Pedobacter sp. CFBP9032]